MCKLVPTEDYRVFHKIIFRGCPIIHSLSNGVVGELSIIKPYKIEVVGDWVILYGKNLFFRPNLM